MASFQTAFDAESLRLMMHLDYLQAVAFCVKMLAVKKEDRVQAVLEVIRESGMCPWAVAIFGTPSVAEKLQPLGVHKGLAVCIQEQRFSPSKITIEGIHLETDLRVGEPVSDLVLPFLSIASIHGPNWSNVSFPNLESASRLWLVNSRGVRFDRLIKTGDLSAQFSQGLSAPRLEVVEDGMNLTGAKDADLRSLKLVGPSANRLNNERTVVDLSRAERVNLDRLEVVCGTVKVAATTQMPEVPSLPALRYADFLSLNGYGAIYAPQLQEVVALTLESESVQTASKSGAPEWVPFQNAGEIPPIRVARNTVTISGVGTTLPWLETVGSLRLDRAVNACLPRLKSCWEQVKVYMGNGNRLPALEEVKAGRISLEGGPSSDPMALCSFGSLRFVARGIAAERNTARTYPDIEDLNRIRHSEGGADGSGEASFGFRVSAA